MFRLCFRQNPDCPLPNNKKRGRNTTVATTVKVSKVQMIYFKDFLRLNFFIFKSLTFRRIIGKVYRKADVRTLADFTDNFKS